jgi:hypothetical protein
MAQTIYFTIREDVARINRAVAHARESMHAKVIVSREVIDESRELIVQANALLAAGW